MKIRCHSFPTWVSTPPPTPFSEVVSYVYTTAIFLSRSPFSPGIEILYVRVKVHVGKFCVYWWTYSALYPQIQYHRESFQCFENKRSFASRIQSFSPTLNTWQLLFYHHCSIALWEFFSRQISALILPLSNSSISLGMYVHAVALIKYRLRSACILNCKTFP